MRKLGDLQVRGLVQPVDALVNSSARQLLAARRRAVVASSSGLSSMEERLVSRAPDGVCPAPLRPVGALAGALK